MPSRNQSKQQNAARAAAALTYKKRKLETSAPPTNLSQQEINCLNTFNMGNIDDTSNPESKSEGTRRWYQNESANESDSDTEGEKRNQDTNKEKTQLEMSRAEPVASFKPAVLKQKKEAEHGGQGLYGKRSISIQKRQKISAQEQAKKTSQSYNIQALWQRG